MSESDIHTCSYQCHRPECIKAQRDELRNRFTTLETENAQLRAELADCETENNYLRADLAETEAKLAAMREQEQVAWIVDNDKMNCKSVEFHNDNDHSPVAIERETAMGWRFTPLYTAPQHAIPEGFVLAPVEPTPAMMEAGANEVVAPIPTAAKKAYFIYKAMLAALQESTHDN
jgi:hypothetical protein